MTPSLCEGVFLMFTLLEPFPSIPITKKYQFIIAFT
jgi:hypothetical protein